MRGHTTVIGLLAVSVLVVVSCGDGDATDTTAAATTTEAVPATDAATTTEVPTTVVATTTTSLAGTTTSESPPPAEEPAVGVYFLRDELLQVIARSTGALDPRSALEALVAGPTEAEAAAGLVTLIPEGTEVLGVEVDANVITVDLSGEFGTGGGSMSVLGRATQVVFTATQFEGIDTVYFRLDGEPITELTGEGLMVGDGLGRLDITYVLPFILLDQPLPGERVTQPIHISGVSNTFEATLNYEVLDPDGGVLLEGFTTATSGNGTWGTFDHDLPALPAGVSGSLTLRVFEVSSDTGEHVNVQEIQIEV